MDVINENNSKEERSFTSNENNNNSINNDSKNETNPHFITLNIREVGKSIKEHEWEGINK